MSDSAQTPAISIVIPVYNEEGILREAVTDLCSQLDEFRAGLMQATLDRDESGDLVRKAGIMAIVLVAGEVRTGDPLRIELPREPHRSLEPV